MKPRTFPILIAVPLAAAVLFPAPTAGQTRLKQVAEHQVFAGTDGEKSLIVEARGFAGPGRPLVFGGNFRGSVRFPTPGGLSWSGLISGTAGIDSIFYGKLRETTPGGGWHAGQTSADFDRLVPVSAFSLLTPSCELRDMTIVSENESYLTGVLNNTTWLTKKDGTSITVATAPQVVVRRGFIASAAGAEIAALTLTNLNLRPHAIAEENGTGHVVVFGQQRDANEPDFEKMEALLHRYEIPDTSTLVDVISENVESKFANMDAKDVVVTTNDDIWVAGSVSGIVIEGTPPTGDPIGGTADLWVGRADFPNSQVVDDFLLGSEGFDEWGGMEPGPNGEIYVAFKVGGSNVNFGGLTLTLPSFPVSHSCLGMIRSDGTPAWVTLLARGRGIQSAMLATDLDIDAAGNAYVSITANGLFDVRNAGYTMNGTGQIVVDGTGRVVSFTPTPNVVTARASVVYDIENRFVLGRSSPFFVEGKASFSTIQSQGITQESYTISWIIPSDNDNTIAGLDRRVTEIGGQVHLTSNFHFPPLLPIKDVLAYLTPDQVGTLGGVPGVIFKLDPLTVTPDQGAGEQIDFESVSNAGWALARLLDPFTLASGAEAQFHYPAGFVTSTSDAKKVRVYIIDKGLAPGQTFTFPDLDQPDAVPISFDGDKGLCVDALAHQSNNGALDPDTASDHPKQAVNLVGAAALGSAQGTAMEFISVDMYTGASLESGNCLTYLSYVSHGILQAVADANERNLLHLALGLDPLPSLIVIASSGPTPITELNIEGAIGQALANNIPVILSAGNDGANVEEYLPAELGTLEGVITVGGIAEGSAGNRNPFYSNTNTDASGNIISLYAPGEGVPTGFGANSGTSYSCALVAGIAATYLSLNPTATPAEVEQALIDFSYRDETRGINIAQTTCSFAAWLIQNGLGDLINTPNRGMSVDTDGDGLSTLGEFLGRSDPNDRFDKGAIPTSFSLTPTSAVITALLPRQVVGADGHLGDGCGAIPFAFELSDDLENWFRFDPTPDIIRGGEVRGDLRELSLELEIAPPLGSQAFVRLVFGPP